MHKNWIINNIYVYESDESLHIGWCTGNSWPVGLVLVYYQGGGYLLSFGYLDARKDPEAGIQTVEFNRRDYLPQYCQIPSEVVKLIKNWVNEMLPEYTADLLTGPKEVKQCNVIYQSGGKE